MTPTPCPGCGAPAAAGARFCGRCGRSLGPAAARGAGPRPGGAWLWAGLVTVAALGASLVLLLRPRPAAPAPADAGPGFAGRAPDISTLSPRQAFDRLFDRVMTAAANGDSATVVRFTEHALAAYAQLPSADSDARYHAAVLHAQLGRFPEALALADSILAETPGHLLGFLVRGTVAGLQGDAVALALARRDFLAAWARDPGTGRPEYLDHKSVLDEFHAAASAAR